MKRAEPGLAPNAELGLRMLAAFKESDSKPELLIPKTWPAVAVSVNRETLRRIIRSDINPFEFPRHATVIVRERKGEYTLRVYELTEPITPSKGQFFK